MVEILILLAILAEIALSVWALIRQSKQDKEKLDLERRMVEALEESQQELADIRDATVSEEEDAP
jgi:hypothetical protein